jgi:hypothetical protein
MNKKELIELIETQGIVPDHELFSDRFWYELDEVINKTIQQELSTDESLSVEDFEGDVGLRFRGFYTE